MRPSIRPPARLVPFLALLALSLAPALLAPAPAEATFSLCAVDPETGEVGVAVTTRVPFVGRAVPWVRAGVGAVATQSWTVVEYGPRGLDLLEDGLEPRQVLDRLLADDDGRELRQVGVLAVDGTGAAFTGEENSPWAGSRQGPNYTVQGNLLVGRQVIDAVADHFESTEGTGMPLAERLILALAAGQAEGGDARWGNLQSAALKVADPNDPGRGGDHLSFDIQVGEHPTPVAELERIYRTTARRLGWRSFSEVRGPDVFELKQALHTLGYYRPDLEALPEPPELDLDPQRGRGDKQAFEESIRAYSEKARAFSDAWQVYDQAAVEAVDAFREAHDLDHSGNPRGWVDEAFVEALRAALRAHEEGEPEDGTTSGDTASGDTASGDP